MRFKTYEEIRSAELATGQDMILGSCCNFAAGPGLDDGEGIYIGQSDLGARVVLLVNMHQHATLLDQGGNMLAQGDINELPVSDFSWLHPY